MMLSLRCYAGRNRRVFAIHSAGVSANLRCRQVPVRYQHLEVNSSHLPRIVQPSIWESIFPRSLRTRTKEVFKAPQKRPINPASYFIWIYILIGSQAIKIIGIQNDFDTYMRKADLKIGKLREVVEKLQRGESVDVERVLGTDGDEEEREWEEALKEIEREDRAWQEGRKKWQEEHERLEAEKQDASPITQTDAKSEATPDLPTSIPRSPPSQPGFY